MTPRSKKPPPKKRRFLFRLVLLGIVAAAVYVPFRQHRQRQEVARLEQVRAELRGELARVLGQDPRLAEAPPGGVLIGAPARFTSRLVHQLADGLFQQTEIHLSNLKVRKRGQVGVNTLFGRMTPGSYALNITVNEIRGKVKAGEPDIRYEDDLAHVTVPGTIREGRGRATIRFAWESKGLAGLACGDVDVTERIEGHVLPRTYPVEGAIRLSLEQDHVRAVPRVPDFHIRLYVQPSKASWRAVDRLLESQGLRCRTALKLVDVPKALQGLLDRGLKVKIPSRKLKPFRLPAGFRDTVTLGETTYALAVEPRGLEAVQDILWYGADLRAQAHERESTPEVLELPAPSPVPLPTEPPPSAVEAPEKEPTPAPASEAPEPEATPTPEAR
jgi:hypothetical protein